HYVPRNDGVICVIARPQAVAIHAFGSHGLLHCVRNDESVHGKERSEVAIHGVQRHGLPRFSLS
ncbi:MAG: hypothetical protein WAZ63_08495, partial [Rhodoferax sp.]